MAQFDVHEFAGGMRVVDCQADLLDHLATRFVVPLVDPDSVPKPLKGLHPIIEIDGERRLLATHLAASVPISQLGRRVVSLRKHYLTVSRAIDFLLTGV
jgi:toxin CcdB